MSEEELHPWRPAPLQTLFPDLNFPLLRVWDYCSGSIPDESNHMLARASRARLDTQALRISSLTTQVYHKDWTDTPFISFTDCPRRLHDLASYRKTKGNRGSQQIIVIDPNIRLKKGLPVLKILPEMKYYGIRDPYRQGNRFYQDEYICLWEVSGEEVVGRWSWDDLSQNVNWYHEIIMPAYRMHKQDQSTSSSSSSSASVDDTLSGIYSMMETLHVSENISDPVDTEEGSASPDGNSEPEAGPSPATNDEFEDDNAEEGAINVPVEENEGVESKSVSSLD